MSASKFPQVKYLPFSKQYHWNIIYDDDSDTLSLSHEFVEFLVQKLEGCYGTKCFYCRRDALAGKSVFREFFRGVDSSIWTLVIVTNGFSENCWANYCKDAAFYNNIVKNNADKLIPVIIGDAVKPMELETNTALHFHSDCRYWDDEKIFKKLEKLLVNEPLSQISGAAVLDVPVLQMTSAEVAQKTTAARSQPGEAGASNSHSLNNELETDNPEVLNIVSSERQITAVCQSPLLSSVSFESLSSDSDLTCDQPPTSRGDQTNDELELSGKSHSVDSLVNSLSNDHSESTNPKQILSPSDSGYTSGVGMTPAHDISSPSQENLKRGVNSYKSDTKVNNSAQLDLHNPELKNTRSKDTRYNHTQTLEDTSGQRLRLDETEAKNFININTQERLDPVRVERRGPDGCGSDASFSMISTMSRWMPRSSAGYREVLVRSLFHSITKTDMLSSWS